MIKKDSSGRVIEFEDESATASMRPGEKARPATTASPSVKMPTTERKIDALFDAEVKRITAEHAAKLRESVNTLGAAVAKVEQRKTEEKRKLEQLRKTALNELDRIRKEEGAKVEADHQASVGLVMSAYYDEMAPLNAEAKLLQEESKESLAAALAKCNKQREEQQAALREAQRLDALPATPPAPAPAPTSESASPASAPAPEPARDPDPTEPPKPKSKSKKKAAAQE